MLRGHILSVYEGSVKIKDGTSSPFKICSIRYLGGQPRDYSCPNAADSGGSHYSAPVAAALTTC